MACRNFPVHMNSSAFENLPVEAEAEEQHPSSEIASTSQAKRARARRVTKTKKQAPVPTIKQRYGLPKDFVPRLQRYERSILLEQNVYRLPDGQEFIPCHPTGTLGTRQHMYALLTTEQYLKGKRGSVYVRTDGRIFDYSVDSAIPLGDIFDTGYTIYDLERTGKYAPVPRGKKTTETAKVRRAAAAG